MSPSSENVLATAAAMTASGLQAAGYTYVNLDDGIVEVDRDAGGSLVPTAAMGSWKALSDTLHSQGFQFGVYTDRGPKVSLQPAHHGTEAQAHLTNTRPHPLHPTPQPQDVRRPRLCAGL